MFFLQNIITDLLLGYDIKEVFEHFAEYIRKKYKVTPGFVTLNMPYLKRKLEEWGIEQGAYQEHGGGDKASLVKS